MFSNLFPSRRLLTLDALEHSKFLASSPRDIITGDLLKAEDKVAVCKVCHAVILEDSLDYLQWRHCNQTFFTVELPSVEPILFVQKAITYKKAKFEAMLFAWFFDIVINLFGHILIYLFIYLDVAILEYFGIIFNLNLTTEVLLVLLFYLFYIIFYGTKDAWFNGQSLGMRLLNIRVIHDTSQNKCSIKKALLRTLLSPLHIFSPVFAYFGKENLVNKLSQTSVVEDKN